MQYMMIFFLHDFFFQKFSTIKYIIDKKIHKTNIDVILASHTHQVPHVGFPHIDPVTKAIMLKTKPDGARLLK